MALLKRQTKCLPRPMKIEVFLLTPAEKDLRKKKLWLRKLIHSYSRSNIKRWIIIHLPRVFSAQTFMVTQELLDQNSAPI